MRNKSLVEIFNLDKDALVIYEDLMTDNIYNINEIIKNRLSYFKYDKAYLDFSRFMFNIDISKIHDQKEFKEILDNKLNTFHDTINDLIELLQENNINVILINMLPVYPYQYFVDQINKDEKFKTILKYLDNIKEIKILQEYFNTVLVKLSKEYKLKLIDVRNTINEEKYYHLYLEDDGINLNEKGIKLINYKLKNI